MDDILKDLNAEQRQAVTHVDGPLLIFAGAGSGKTRVIVHRVAHLIRQGVPASQILCLTFTNKAALEMKERLERMLGHGYPGMWAGTFHAFGAWFLRHEAHRLGYPRSFVIYDSEDQRSLVNKCIRDLKLKASKGADTTMAWLIAMAKDTLQDPKRIPCKLDFDPGPVIALYEERKKAYGAFDFGDLLKVPGEMLQGMPEVKDRYQSLFRYLLVDEYQDTNMAQYVMLMGLVNPEQNICVVGDDDQSIYGWRGADVGNILRFKDDFPRAQKAQGLEARRRGYRHQGVPGRRARGRLDRAYHPGPDGSGREPDGNRGFLPRQCPLARDRGKFRSSGHPLCGLRRHALL